MTWAFEGFRNTFVETQSYAAIPVVFYSYPVASWIVDDGKSGFLIEPFDVESRADRTLHLARNPKRERFAKHALESARHLYIERVGRTWQSLFEAEVSKHVGRHELETTA